LVDRRSGPEAELCPAELLSAAEMAKVVRADMLIFSECGVLMLM